MNQTLRRLGRRASNVVCIAGVVVGAAAAPSLAQIGDTVVSRELAPGVAYRQFVDTRGPLVAYLVRVDLRRSDLELREVRADDRLRGRQKPTDMVRRVASD
ncbi:MAG: hypothetical protein ACM3SX_16940, partial [Deltaproteobacteria bacterium]